TRPGDFFEAPSRVGVGLRMAQISSLSHPPKKFRGIEETVAVVNHGSRNSVLEFEIADMGPFRPAWIPRPGHGAHASNHAAAQEPYDIDLMRPLVENHASARFQVPVGIGPHHEIVKVPRVDHAPPPQFAASDDLSHLADRRIE